MVVREGNDDLADAIAGSQCFNGGLEDRSAIEIKELLWPIGAETHPPASGGNDGGRKGHELEDLIVIAANPA
jgi:hypothetical protein